MSWSREEALTDPAVREPMIFVSEFRFHLKDIATEITIRLYRPLFHGDYIVRRSHHLSIPQVEIPPTPAEDDGEPSEGGALHKAMQEYISLYNAACAQGLVPSPIWLTRNPEFR